MPFYTELSFGIKTRRTGDTITNILIKAKENKEWIK